jgi:hypothetical protein
MRHSFLVLVISFSLSGSAQSAGGPDDVPIRHCDRLPVVQVTIDKAEMRFLVDTGATSMLNLRSFEGGKAKSIEVNAWNGTAATSAKEVTLPSLALGTHRVRDLKLPAIDLSPIGKACGGPIDGILGIDLMERMGITLDLKNRLASFKGEPQGAKEAYDEMEAAMHPCTMAFQSGNREAFAECLDPEIVLYTPHGEFKGREQVLQYLEQRYFKFAPNLRYSMELHEAQVFGDALWYSYDYTIDMAEEHVVGHGMSMCRKTGGKWRILNMHNSHKQ